MRYTVTVSLLVTLGVSALVPVVLAHPGGPLSLFEHVLSKNYELLADGNESFVLSLGTFGEFYREVLTSKKPVVIKFFSGEASRTSLNGGFQSLAYDFRNTVKCASVDMKDSVELMNKLIAFFIKTGFARDSKNMQKALQTNMTRLLHHISSSGGSATSDPFFLFFHQGHMIIPHQFVFQGKEDLAMAINKSFEHAVESASNRQTQRSSWWRSLKRRFFGKSN